MTYTPSQIEALKNVKLLAADGYDNNHVIPNRRTAPNYQQCLCILKQELPRLFSLVDGQGTCVVNQLCVIRGLAWKELLTVDPGITY